MRTREIIKAWNRSVRNLYRLSGGSLTKQVIREELETLKANQRTSLVIFGSLTKSGMNEEIPLFTYQRNSKGKIVRKSL